jgi:hypothetical protein
VLVGTWSSALTATPLAVALERRWPAPPVAHPPHGVGRDRERAVV